MTNGDGDLHAKQAGAIAGLAAMSAALAAVCAFATFLCSYAQGYGFAKGLKEGMRDNNTNNPHPSRNGPSSYNPSRSTYSSGSFLRDEDGTSGK